MKKPHNKKSIWVDMLKTAIAMALVIFCFGYFYWVKHGGNVQRYAEVPVGSHYAVMAPEGVSCQEIVQQKDRTLIECVSGKFNKEK